MTELVMKGGPGPQQHALALALSSLDPANLSPEGLSSSLPRKGKQSCETCYICSGKKKEAKQG